MKRRQWLTVTGLTVLSGKAFSGATQKSANERITCGFIGVGGRGTGLLHTVLDGLPDVDVVAVCDINPDRLSSAVKAVESKRGKTPTAIGGGGTKDNYAYRKLVENKTIDTLVISTPCNWHYPMYRDCLMAEKHFYGEKPMCISVKEADDLWREHKRHPKTVVTIGYQRRANARYQEAINAVRGGAIGTLIEGRAAWNNAWGPLRGWFSRRKESGDWMVEQACHTWDVFYWLLGSAPSRAFAVGRQDIFAKDEPGRDVTDFYGAILEWPNGFWLTFTHAWGLVDDAAFIGVYERVVGTDGVCDLGGGRIRTRAGQRLVGRDVNDTLELLRDFFKCVRTGEKTLSGVENGRISVLIGLLVAQAVYRRDLVTWEQLLKGR
ncbi:MAG: Gfo/Idh/MocA family oxidoreductase [Armatimonadetes bacterium]|nr:Gfo/Idh/MocA family oxidoreductase [Armatimonadota bacterium]MDW8121953.1 Gfo/Idh/MocA family oxidoreductase [Armatimonadota bacterium]